MPVGQKQRGHHDQHLSLTNRSLQRPQRFRVLRRSIHRGGNSPPSYEVEYRNGTSLLIPISATERDNSENNLTKLSITALQDLLAMIDCFDSHEHKSKRSLDDAAAVSTTPDRRRRRRSLGGGLS